MTYAYFVETPATNKSSFQKLSLPRFLKTIQDDPTLTPADTPVFELFTIFVSKHYC